jgi:hypothetical protein
MAGRPATLKVSELKVPLVDLAAATLASGRPRIKEALMVSVSLPSIFEDLIYKVGNPLSFISSPRFVHLMSIDLAVRS